MAETDTKATTGNGEAPPPADLPWSEAPQPWRRFGARMIDTMLVGQLLFILTLIPFAAFASDATLDTIAEGNLALDWFVFAPLTWALGGLSVAAMLTWWGTTLGKWVFGLRVVHEDGTRPSFGRALKREALLMLWGAGLAMPVFNLVALIYSYGELERGNRLKWDAHTGLVSQSRNLEGLRHIVMLIGAIVVVLVLLGSRLPIMADIMSR